MNKQAQASMFRAIEIALEDVNSSNAPWTGVTVRFSLPDLDESHLDLFIYIYNGPDYTTHFLSDNTEQEFFETIMEFRRLSQVPNDIPWCACLMQVTRDGMKFTSDLEYDDPARWDVTAQNLETRVKELRPKGA